MSQLHPDEYRCAMCKQVYTKLISDEEAIVETQSYWPGVTQRDCAIVCDVCWQKIHPDQHPMEYEQSVADLAIQQALTALQDTDNPSDVLLLLDTIQQQMIKAFGIPPALLEVIDTNLNASVSQQKKKRRGGAAGTGRNHEQDRSNRSNRRERRGQVEGADQSPDR